MFSQVMGMADSNRQGIGSIGTGQGGKTQQDFDHMLHLPFFRLTVPYNRSFNFFGTVIMDPQAILHGRNHRRPPGLTKLESRAGIVGHEHILNCRDLGIMELNNLIDSIKDLIEAMSKRKLWGRLYHPTGHKSYLAGNNLDHTVTSQPGTGINAQNADHGKRTED